MKLLIISSILLAAASAQYSNHTNYYPPSYSSTEEQCDSVRTVYRNKGLTFLLDLLTETDLSETVFGIESYTIFAPVNSALNAFDHNVIQRTLKNPDLLRQIFTYHVVPTEISPSWLDAIFQEYNLPTVQEIPLRINVYRNRGFSFLSQEVITVNGALILDVVPVCKGFVYFIDKVLSPRDLAPYNTELEVLKNNGFTTIIKIYEILGFTPNINIFFGQETFFAPTDKAFAALPPSVLDSLLADKKALSNVLYNHFVSGTFYTRGLASGPVPTFSGLIVPVEFIPGGAIFGNANIILPDLTNIQGVIHGIDKVILGKQEYLLTSGQQY